MNLKYLRTLGWAAPPSFPRKRESTPLPPAHGRAALSLSQGLKGTTQSISHMRALESLLWCLQNTMA